MSKWGKLNADLASIEISEIADMFSRSAARSLGSQSIEKAARKRYEALAHHALEFILQDETACQEIAAEAFGDLPTTWTSRSEVRFKTSSSNWRRADIVITSAESDRRLVLELKVHSPLSKGQAADNLEFANKVSSGGQLWVVGASFSNSSTSTSNSDPLLGETRYLTWDSLCDIGARGVKRHLWLALRRYVHTLINQASLGDVGVLDIADVAAEFESLLKVFVELADYRRYSASAPPSFYIEKGRQVGSSVWLQAGASVTGAVRPWGLEFSGVPADADTLYRTAVWFRRMAKPHDTDGGYRSTQLGTFRDDASMRAAVELVGSKYSVANSKQSGWILTGCDDFLGTEVSSDFEQARRILFASLGRILDVCNELGVVLESTSNGHRFGMKSIDPGVVFWMGPPVTARSWTQLGIWIGDERVELEASGFDVSGEDYVNRVELAARASIARRLVVLS